jgi:flagellar hook-associated protein 2
MSKLRSEFFEEFNINDNDSISLINLGIESDQYGVLSLDTDVLNDYIDNDPDGVEQFFVGTEDVGGFAVSMEELIGYYTDDTYGIMQSRIDSKSSQIDDLDDDYASFELRMDQLEARLYSQYNAMDLIVANLNSTSSYLLAQLENMPGVVSSSS